MAPPLPSPRLLPPLLLALAGAAQGTWSVVAWPRVAVVAFGGSVAINCTLVACPVANVTLGLATPLEVAPGATGTHWRLFRLLNVTRWDPPPVTCWGHCGDNEDEGDGGDKGDKATAGVIVYKLPAGVVLEPVAAVAVGDTWNLTCHVLEVAPVTNLTVTLRKGTETLGTGRWQSGDTKGSTNVTFSHPLTASPGDNGQDVTCHAELSLRPHGPLFARAAVPVTLEVFALPAPPQLLAPSLLEFGVTSVASCRVTGAFPVPRLRVTMALARQDLNLTVTSVGDVVTAVTTLSPTSLGRQEVTCTAEVATVTRTARSLLHVYSFPPPLLEVSPRPVAAGREVTLRCHSDVTDPPAAQLQLHDVPGGVLAQGPPPSLSLRLVARRDDDKRRVGCRASLAIGDTQVTKDTETQLDVLFPPQMSPSDCPRTLTWLRGTRVTLSCGATGNPPPIVTCARHGVPVPTATPQLVTRSRAGTYVCNATNTLGTRSQEVTVRVESEPTLTERGCPSHVTWVEGDIGDFGCQAEGDPPATTLCSRPGEGPQGGPQPNVPVSRTQAGRYLCRASNKHGVATRSVLVTVEYEPHLGDRGCPSWRRWVEGTPAVLSCAATGNPPPRVTCRRLGGEGDPPEMILGTHPWKGDPDPQQPPPPTVTRGHAGIYECRGSNGRGTAWKNVTVSVEYRPSAVTLRVVPSATVPRGGTFSVECMAEGSPPPSFGWALPPAPNLLLAPDNRSVTVTAATATNGGHYTCTATNPHGHRAASVLVHVQESWVALVATLASLGATTLVALMVAGFWYLKSTACKKGEYNVRDAEGAACHRPRCHRPQGHRGHRPEVYGIQLTPPPP